MTAAPANPVVRKLKSAVRRGRSFAARLAPWRGGATEKFRRETRALSAGIARYWADHSSATGAGATLRRNTHMLEKGIVMRPRRDVFALAYIEETVEAYAKRLAAQPEDGAAAADVLWAHDVLKIYFSITASDPVIDAQRARFGDLPAPRRQDPKNIAPYARDLGNGPPVAYDDLLALSILRRSVRWFLPRPVPRELVEKAMDVALQSPSACNRQPFVFRFFDEPEMVKKVADVPMGTAGYGHQIPTIAVVVGQQRNFFDERDRHLIYIDGALAAMAFCFAAETLGLATCLINWPDIEEREQRMAALLGLEADERPVMLIGIGYPDPEGMVPASAKKQGDSVFRFG